MDRDSCLDDAQLLALVEQPDAEPAVGAHLERCDVCRERLSRLRADVAVLRDTARFCDKRVTKTPASLPDYEQHGLPSAIGPYLVLEWLGRGGEADVFRAEHPVLRHNVALKWSRRPFQGDAEPLVAEGRLLASLDVEGVARVFDLGLHEGRPYLVMQMLRGRTLNRYAAEASLSHREIARLVARVAHILGRAHANQVWHRDLKPSNIVIDGQGKPTVIDFGMASFCQPWRDDAPCSGGTLHFMSPEQAKDLLGICDERTGALPAVGPRSDIFALGAVLYSLLSEQAPYPRSESSPELIERVCRGDFDRQRLASRGVPKRLAAICLKAMAYDPAERYVSADDLAHDLERFGQPAPRKRWLWTAASFTAIGVCVAAVAWQRGGEMSRVAVDRSPTEQPASHAAVPQIVAEAAAPTSVATDSSAAATQAPSEPEAGGSHASDEKDKGQRPHRIIKGRNKDETATKPEPKAKSRWWIPRWLRDRGK